MIQKNLILITFDNISCLLFDTTFILTLGFLLCVVTLIDGIKNSTFFSWLFYSDCEEEDKMKENLNYMKTNKDHIKNILKNPDTLPIINDLVNRTNKIVVHSYQFIKLYFIFLYENELKFLLIDRVFISHVFKVLTIRRSGSGGYIEDNMPPQLQELTKFYQKNYSKTISSNEAIYYDKLPYVLNYEATDMVTNINNNIKENFIDRLNKYVNIVFDMKEKSAKITIENKDKILRKQLHKQWSDEINKIKKDLTCFGKFTSDEKHHKWITEKRIQLYPNKKAFYMDNINYELESNAQTFLYSMFHITTELEKINEIRIKNEKKQIRLFNSLPLRTNIINKYISIDTCALISNFLGDESTTKHRKNFKKENNQTNLWNKFFNLSKKVFKKGEKYKFSHMIRTDGVSCCILFVRVDTTGKPLPKKCKNKNFFEKKSVDYIENVELTEKLKNMKVICADPNYSDLIYCGSKDDKGNLQTFRYTQNQRRLETGLKKYTKITNKINKETIIENQSISEIQTELSVLNSKSCDYDKFMSYSIEKNKMNLKLHSHYGQTVFRKFKFNRFTNTQKSESKMIKNFSKKYGKPDKTLFVIGDYDKGDSTIRGKELVICKKFRIIFRNAGYITFLVNEFNTSKLCNECHGELEHFLIRKSKKPKWNKENKTEICYGLLRCQSVKHKSEIVHNRDKNSVQNMLSIVKSLFHEGKRPSVFSRKTFYLNP